MSVLASRLVRRGLSYASMLSVFVTFGALAPASASAAIINIQGDTSGSFQETTTNVTFAGLSDFSWTTDAAGSADVVLGTVTLNSYAAWSNRHFDLVVAFAIPGADAQSVTFTALASSTSLFGFSGSANLTFDSSNITRHIAYTTAAGTGEFDLTIQDRLDATSNSFELSSLTGTTVRNITAQVSNATFVPVPEPGAVVVTGVLAGIAVLRRRRNPVRTDI